MQTVSMRDLRNHGKDVIDRVLRGETMLLTRDGSAVAELRPLQSPGLSGAELVARWRGIPPIDDRKFRADIDEILDSTV